jgi:hypothetical protein
MILNQFVDKHDIFLDSFFITNIMQGSNSYDINNSLFYGPFVNNNIKWGGAEYVIEQRK